MNTHLVRHHKKCKSNGGKNNKGNISMIPYCVHVAWHIVFENFEAHKIAAIINKQFLDPEWEFIVQKRRHK